MKLSELLSPGEYQSKQAPEEIEITDICYHSAHIVPGCLFICIQGTRYDSHTLLSNITTSGASAAIVEEGAEYTASPDLPLFIVKNTRRTLAYAYNRFYHEPSKGLHLIAVTGTNGKTSTATMLYHILKEAKKAVAIIGTVSCHSETKQYILHEQTNTMTTPDPHVLYPMLNEMRADGIKYVVMECSSHALALEKLAPLFFEIGIFTNLSNEHLDFHGTMKNYLSAKARLFSQCQYGILNFDDAYAEALAHEATCKILRCGAVYHEQYNAEEIHCRGASGVSYTYTTPNLHMALSIPIPGSFTVYNSLLALTAALQLGISPLIAKEALEEMNGIPGRLERLPVPKGLPFSIFIDYAHTEAALRNLLTTVRQFCRSGERIILLFGCGGDRDRSKRAPMGHTAEELSDLVILTTDNHRTEEPTKIIHDVIQGMKEPHKRRVIVDRRRAIAYAIHHAKENDIILLVGKGHEDYELSDGEMHPFDEKEIVRQLLSELPAKGEA